MNFIQTPNTLSVVFLNLPLGRHPIACMTHAKILSLFHGGRIKLRLT